mgnify:CR=1 FL=1
MISKRKLGIFFHIIVSFVLVSKVNKVHTILLDQSNDSFIQISRSFFVMNERIFIVDSKAGNIKIFNMDGRLKNIFGKKGAGPNEFLLPSNCDISSEYLFVLDRNQRHFLVFDWVGGSSFQYKKKLFSLYLADEFKILHKDHILIAGYNKIGKQQFNSKSYHFYIQSLNKDSNEFLLPSHIAFGCNSHKEYLSRFATEFKYVGRKGFCDFDSKYYYFILQSNLKVIKIDRKTKEISTFGKTTENYMNPFISKRLKDSFGKKIKIYWEEVKKFSHIRNIFVTKSNMIGVIYSNWKNNRINIFLQLYSQDQTFKSEELLLSSLSDSIFDIVFYFNKSKNQLYILDNEPTEDDDIMHKIHSFNVL